MKPSDRSPEPGAPAAASVRAAAEQWARRRAVGLKAAERDEFRAWLRADPAHAAAFARADTTADELDWPLHAGAVDEVLAGLEQRARTRRRRRTTAVATCAVLAIAAVVLWRPHAQRAPAITRASAEPSRLVVLQAHRETLPDGSVVELKEGASLQLAFSAQFRRVTLQQGEAHFQVAKNPQRPFIVSVGSVEVRAVGTAFLVQADPARAEVIVTEGRVAVSSTSPGDTPGSTTAPAAAPPPTPVGAGQRVVVSLHGADAQPRVENVAAADIDARLTWRIPRLEFAGTPLSEVVAMLNHYAEGRPGAARVQAAPEIANLRVSGALRADKIDALVAMLEADFGIEADRTQDGTIALRARR